MITSGTVANVAANGMLLATPTLAKITFPIRFELVPPTRPGAM